MVFGTTVAVVVDGGRGTEARELRSMPAIIAAAATFLIGQMFAPMQTSLGELLARRIDGRIYARLIRASLSGWILPTSLLKSRMRQ